MSAMPFQSNTGNGKLQRPDPVQSGRRRLERAGDGRAREGGGFDELAAHVADGVERPGREVAKRVVVDLTRLAATIEDLDAAAGQIIDHAGVGAVGIAGADAHGDAGLDEGHEGQDRVRQQVHPAGETLAGKIGAAHLRRQSAR